MSSLDLLRRVPVFEGLPEDALGRVAQRLRRQVFAKGVVLFHKDSPGNTLYLIESGRVRIFLLSETGREVTLNTHGPGECFGELALLDGLPRSAGAVTSEKSLVYLLQRDDFLAEMEANPPIARHVIQLLSARLRYATAYTESLAFLDVNGRVASLLVHLGERSGVRDPNGTTITLNLTQTDLATWVAASRETVNRALADFREQGLVSIEGASITILDETRLRRRINY